MKVSSLVCKEIFYRKLNFTLSILAATFAAATFLITASLLRSTDMETARIIDEKVLETPRKLYFFEF